MVHLDDDEVHLWQAQLPLAEADETELRQWLSAEEWQRASSIPFVEQRQLYLGQRATMRRILAGYCAVEPSQLLLQRTENGKPLLAEPHAALQFNLSHSGRWFYLAVARHRALGVDLERSRQRSAEQSLALACRFFHPDECAALRRLPSEQLNDAFLACWVRKEAYIKCRGATIAHHCHRFVVTVAPQQPPAVLLAPEPQTSTIQLLDLQAPEGYRAALAIVGQQRVPLSCHSWRALQSGSERLPE
ncbi:MAG: 4'-phosphopantetheinyl transferase superfamily protein [Magnetococcales bacterium]|nr:4'-phosphopantetheinyl transferase superfamily protein [Magnetococcales bacterium]